MNLKEAKIDIKSFLPKRCYLRGRAEGFIECHEKMKSLVPTLENLTETDELYFDTRAICINKEVVEALSNYRKEVLGEK